MEIWLIPMDRSAAVGPNGGLGHLFLPGRLRFAAKTVCALRADPVCHTAFATGLGFLPDRRVERVA